jgi:hypothetical protein
MNDKKWTEFQRRCYDDAKAAGCSEEVARIIANDVGSVEDASRARADMPRLKGLAGMLAMHGAGSLYPQFRQVGATAANALYMMIPALGQRSKLTDVGLTAVRTTLMSRAHWGTQQ